MLVSWSVSCWYHGVFNVGIIVFNVGVMVYVLNFMTKWISVSWWFHGVFNVGIIKCFMLVSWFMY